MKHGKLLSILSAALLGLSAAAVPVTLSDAPGSIVAEAAESNGFQYTVSSNQVTITKYTGTATSVTIPSYINGKKVVAIGYEAFCYRDNHNVYQGKPIISVSIPNTVESIGDRAFHKCPLKTLVLPASVTLVGQGAFQACTELTSVNIQGAAEIGSNAFTSCTKLKNVRMNAACHKMQNPARVFDKCSALTNLNGLPAVVNVQDENGNPMPALHSSANVRAIIKEFFADCCGVKFVDTYCTALCQYVVNTRTRDWMSDALKARQLHDWLAVHCKGEDDPDDHGKRDNDVYSSVFLSYGVDERGSGVGETVCEGFAKAYTMLLTQAGIESYVLFADNTQYETMDHNWNLLKVDGKYYQTDITLDAPSSTATNISYLGFLKKKSRMEELHSNQNGSQFWDPTIQALSAEDSHPLLNYDVQTGQVGLNQCIHIFDDTNQDGLLDSDWDFNGTVDWDDYLIYSKVCAACNVPYMGVEGQSQFLNNLLICNMSPAQWAQSF